ncbi:MAG: hypothetical protein H6R07_2535 [Proteobacteria bacterium]|nr:hypothetical protein [Pseudomonadota bacterium]
MVSNRGSRCGMAYIHRLIKIFAVGFMLILSNQAYATVCQYGTSNCWASPEAAMAAKNPNPALYKYSKIGSVYPQYNGTTYKGYDNYSFWYADTQSDIDFGRQDAVIQMNLGTQCLSGQSYNPTTQTCDCGAGTHKLPVNNYNSTEQCIANSVCKAGTPYTGGLTSQAASQGWACKQDDGCQYNVSSSVKDSSGSYSGTMVGMGTFCTVTGDGTNAVSPLASNEAKCLAAGKSFGTVNGAVVCTNPVESKSTATASSVSTAGDGSKTSTSTTTSTSVNSDGKITTTKTTTSTPTNADGTLGTPSTTTETETQEKSTFCEENPNSTICKDSEFSGACSSAFSCNGDAVQCAIAQDLHKRHCTMFESKTALSDLGTASANGVAITDESPLSSGNRINIDLGGKLDMSRGLSGTCIPSQTIDVMGKSIKLDTTEFCKWADAFGYLVVAISLIGGVKIIGRGM